VPQVEADRSVRRWLAACVAAVVLAVVVGGATRLTESGLSITEWKPVSGALPPLSEGAWQAEYDAFLKIPQAQTVHAGITLDEFKGIFWWEWLHRLVARGVGLVFAIPYVYFLARGRIPGGLRLRLAWLPALTLAQGALGWYMVQSGLAVRTSVSAYRLASHLALALAILVIALWTWLEIGVRPEAREDHKGQDVPRGWQLAIGALVVMIGVTIISGAFVAGLDAGKVYNTFPLMAGGIVPPGYGEMVPWWRNVFENAGAAQFNHRVLAAMTGLFALGLAVTARPAVVGSGAARAMRVLGVVVLVQIGLGITTLLLAVPVWLGVAHQLVGVAVLGAGVVAVFGLRGAHAGPDNAF
jgi:cytochrome c oxidase assembly protein subunit 15